MWDFRARAARSQRSTASRVTFVRKSAQARVSSILSNPKAGHERPLAHALQNPPARTPGR